MNQSLKSISILIATHNRVKLLLQTLQSIAELSIPPDIEIELIICANACTDGTIDACQSQLTKLPFQARCVVEPEPGASYARNRAILESHGDILVFLDDDVWVSHEWLSALLDVFNRYPADIAAGKITLWWNAVEKPGWLSRRSAHMLSCVDHGDKICELFSAGEAASANLAVKRCVLNTVSGFRTDLGRKGRNILAGEDTYFIAEALKAGHRLFYAPRASLLHWVAPERITQGYLGRAAAGIGMAKVLMLPEISYVLWLRLSLENFIKMILYKILELLSAGIYYHKGRINQHIRYMMCRGVLTGLKQRRPLR